METLFNSSNQNLYSQANGKPNNQLEISGDYFVTDEGEIIIFGYDTQDIINFHLGAGKHTVAVFERSQVQDTIRFSEGITSDMLQFKRVDDRLVIQIGNNGDELTFEQFFCDEGYQTFSRFEFADGTIWNDFRQTDSWKNSDLTPLIFGTEGNDYLEGSGIFEGGKGNDYIKATETGSQDTLRFNLGDGQDTIMSFDYMLKQDKIEFGQGITADMISYERGTGPGNKNDLIIKIGNEDDQLTFKGFFESKYRQTFTHIEFSDGTIWNDFRNTSAWQEQIVNNTEDRPIWGCAATNYSKAPFSEPLINQAINLSNAIATFSPQSSSALSLAQSNYQDAALTLAASGV